ncbi:hypothetical protein DUNSADRAFT_10683 [Dunaliella salina]|uniref:Encoded protein n=1 Tax=Dunaliella salina TaxID=3046 RepID=A0ABQ7GET0_DUNSA|nr:hypothetical protein DUNSADRAFT_10683 [Dunaliella salina]|eukprot:KAF5833102.1 hypothetical protein DUNSADRAFT_10683 [Dunaliella salina]
MDAGVTVDSVLVCLYLSCDRVHCGEVVVCTLCGFVFVVFSFRDSILIRGPSIKSPLLFSFSSIFYSACYECDFLIHQHRISMSFSLYTQPGHATMLD